MITLPPQYKPLVDMLVRMLPAEAREQLQAVLTALSEGLRAHHDTEVCDMLRRLLGYD